ncbi:Crp/Fnr family transcriptional regulator [Parapedobacter lycopersici]|uniref:Crp/Fnr family transcriptional regulator n=1 Tax=Parapedobacter lycopersici TaxID=1864939 RepID=UPI003341C47A
MGSPDIRLANMHIDTLFTNVLDIPAESLQKIRGIATLVKFPKGHLLFRAGKLERDLYFVVKGIARVYYHHHANEVTLCFGAEGEALISLKSYITDQPGYENIELLEPCELIQLKTADLQHLYATDIHLANWGRKLAEQELIKTEERLMSRQFKTATARYSELMTHHPHLLLRVQLGHIASYLGVNQVTLSRIRADIR